jgi:hypothetical protein
MEEIVNKMIPNKLISGKNKDDVRYQEIFNNSVIKHT